MSTETTQPSENKTWYVPLILFCVMQFVLMADNMSLYNALSAIADSLNASVGELQLANIIYPLIGGSIMVVAGFMGRKIGWKLLFLAGLLLFCCAEIAAAASVNIYMFIFVARVLAGIGGSLMIPAILGLVTTRFHSGQIAIAFGAIAATEAIGTAVASIISGLVIDQLGWQYAFAGLALLFGAGFVAALLLVNRDEPEKKEARIDLIGFFYLFFGLSLSLYGISEISSWGLIDSQKAPFTIFGLSPCLYFLTGGVLLMSLFFRHQRHHEQKFGPDSVLLPRLFITERRIRSGLWMSAFSVFLLGGVGFVIVLFMQVILMKNAIITGFHISIFAGGIAVTSLLTPVFAKGLSIRTLCRSGIIIAIAGCYCVAGGITVSHIGVLFYLGLFMLGLGGGLVASQAALAVTGSIEDPALASASSGIQGAARNIGQAVGVALIGLVLIASLTTSVKMQLHHTPDVSNDTIGKVVKMQSIPLLSDKKLHKKLSHKDIPTDEAARLIQVNASGQIAALRMTFVFISLICAVFLLFTGALSTRSQKQISHVD